MKIYEFSPFNNENLVATLKLKENSSWVDQTFIIEANRNFQNKIKKYNFKQVTDEVFNVEYKQINVSNDFTSDTFGKKLRRKLKSIAGYNDTVEFGSSYVEHPIWQNDAYQRNYPEKIIRERIDEFSDDDILIFSDIDEIIDSKYKNIIIDSVKKHGIMTIKIHFTMFYFNLFVGNWGGAPDYSYRIFIMTVERFKKMKITLDMLRKAGERGKLQGLIYCPDEFMGFHHSWLGDIDFIKNKIQSYAHIEHMEFDDKEYLEKCILNGESFIPGVTLHKNKEISMLDSLSKNKNIFKGYFFE